MEDWEGFICYKADSWCLYFDGSWKHQLDRLCLFVAGDDSICIQYIIVYTDILKIASENGPRQAKYNTSKVNRAS
jgi:hypothetical protein